MPDATIGILAGMGPRSTGPFVDLVVSACQTMFGARHDIDFPRMLICSQPAPFYEDRTIDHAALESATLSGLKCLQFAGVDFIGIACNTVHIYYPRLARELQVPLLNIVELAAMQTKQRKGKVAIVAARPTVESNIYQRAITAHETEVVDLCWQDDVDRLLSAVRETTDPAVFQALWKPITAKASSAGLRSIVLACLDLSGVAKYWEPEIPIVDAADCLAQELVRQWLARR